LRPGGGAACIRNPGSGERAYSLRRRRGKMWDGSPISPAKEHSTYLEHKGRCAFFSKRDEVIGESSHGGRGGKFMKGGGHTSMKKKRTGMFSGRGGAEKKDQCPPSRSQKGEKKMFYFYYKREKRLSAPYAERKRGKPS